MNKSHYSQHQDLLKTILKIAPRKIPNLRLFPYTVGLFYTKNDTPVKVGINGFPDLFGWVELFPEINLFLCVEVKSGKVGIKKNSDQDRFRKVCIKSGVIHLVARDVNQFIKDLNSELDKRRNLFKKGSITDN